MQAHLITILINRPRRCEREAIIMQMNDDFSTLNCFVSSLCWLHKYWRRSVFIYCNFVIVLPKKTQKHTAAERERREFVDKLFHSVNPLTAAAAVHHQVLLLRTPHDSHPLYFLFHCWANRSTDTREWSALMIFMCSWKHRPVGWWRCLTAFTTRCSPKVRFYADDRVLLE